MLGEFAGGDALSASVLTFAFKGLKHIEKSQVAQIGPEQWEVRVVPLPGFSEADADQIIANIHKLVAAGVQVMVKPVADIPRTRAGKFRWVVNEWQSPKRSSPTGKGIPT